MTKLSINVNKLATLRNARGKNNPDVVASSLNLIKLGAEGITVHPRPDGRHIRHDDVYALKAAIDKEHPGLEFNIEGYPSEDFLDMVEEVQPAQCTLVPDPPDAITSNAGWQVQKSAELLKQVAGRLKAKGIRSSVFVDPSTMKTAEYDLLKQMGVDRVELYTEDFAETFGTEKADKSLKNYIEAATLARNAGLGVNAGHDLSLENLTALITAIPWIDEVSIGHALVCDALWLGFQETVQRYLKCIEDGTRAARVSTSGR
jgi:pyridoxine 5-phosphate synthase